MIRSTLVALPAAAALLLGGAALTANAAPTTAAECVQDGLVWVHVQYDDEMTGACAEKFTTAAEALLTTGLTKDTGAFLSTVDGRTADGTTATEYWGVWTKAPAADGSFPAGWEFAQVGITELALEPSDVLALNLELDWTVEATAPTVDPVAGVVLSDDAATPEPTVAPTGGPTEVPSPTATASTPSEAQPTPVATPTSGGTPGLPSSGV